MYPYYNKENTYRASEVVFLGTFWSHNARDAEINKLDNELGAIWIAFEHDVLRLDIRVYNLPSMHICQGR